MKKILFIYPDFSKIVGGASVHGYNLSKNLAMLGYDIRCFNQEELEFVIRYKKNYINILCQILQADIVYIRVHLKASMSKKLLFLLFKILNKKIVIELNAPVDELIKTAGVTKDELVGIEEKLIKEQLNFADSIIVISSVLKKYCEEFLGVTCPVYAIPNGGEKFDPIQHTNIRKKVRLTGDELRIYEKIIIWSGTITKWQDFLFLKTFIEHSPNDCGFILISNNTKSLKEELGYKDKENIYYLSELSRAEILYLTSIADIGLAIYNDYSWSRIGFFGSSLKLMDYSANNLTAIVNQNICDIGSYIPTNIIKIDSLESIRNLFSVNQIGKKNNLNARDWKDVANETKVVFDAIEEKII